MDSDEEFERELLKVKRSSRRRMNVFIGFLLGFALSIAAYVVVYFFPGLVGASPAGLAAEEAAATASLLVLYVGAYLGPLAVNTLTFLRLEPTQRRREWELFGYERARWLRMGTSTVSLLSVVVVVVHLLLSAEMERWALSTEDLLGEGSVRLVTLLTHSVFHADMVHLFNNVFGLIVFGLMVDLRLGRARTALLCGVSMLAGGPVEVLARSGTSISVVGVSAAVYALALAGLVLMPRRRIATAVVSLPQWIVMVPLLAVFFMVDYGYSGVAFYAHVVGAVVGVSGGLLWRKLPEPDVFVAVEAAYQEALQAEEG